MYEVNSHDENHHPHETSNHLDDPPDGFEADWLRWRSRRNRRIRFAHRSGKPSIPGASEHDGHDGYVLPPSDPAKTG